MYIIGFCSISPAGVITPDTESSSLQKVKAPVAPCIEPDYKELITAMQLRRMTKPVRTGVAAAKICMQTAGTVLPSSIHVGTAYGMLQDSENFLQKMIVQEEQMLTPTAFIQSTHNTVAGQIALAMGCYAHNMTFVHKAHSFESALLDACLMTDKTGPLMVGAVDECIPTSYEILKRFGLYTEKNSAGEGASFFLVSDKKEKNVLARIRAFDMFIAEDETRLALAVDDFCTNHQITVDTGDLLLSGLQTEEVPPVFKDTAQIAFKAYSGEFPTAVGFAVAMATLKIRETTTGRCWILNGSGKHYSLFFLEQV